MPYGDAGFNLGEAISNYQMGLRTDPRLFQYFRQVASNDENGTMRLEAIPGSGVDQMGTITRDGQQWAQIDQTPDSYHEGSNAYADDPRFGRLAPVSQVHPASDGLNNVMRWVIPTILSAGAFSGGALGGELLGNGAEASSGLLSRPIDPSLLGNVSGAITPGTETTLTGAPSILGEGTEQIVVNGTRLPPMGPEVNPGLLGTIPAVTPSTNGPTLDDAPNIKPDPNQQRGLLDGLMDNPLQTLSRGYSLFQMGRGLLGGNNNTNTNTDNSGDKGGTGTGVQIPQRQPYQPNPITAAQIQNFQFARPRGM